MPIGLLVTEPATSEPPAPPITVSVRISSKWATTFLLAVMVTTQGPVPVQSPVHCLKTVGGGLRGLR